MNDIQLLLNFLLNFRSCVPMSGPLSGVPPTLFSHVAFHGATLKPLTLKYESNENSSKEKIHIMEVSGPLLPSMVMRLCALLQETQEGNFRAAFLSVDNTTPFTLFNNVLDKNDNISSLPFGTENLKDCGLPNRLLCDLCSNMKQSLKPLSGVVCKSNVVYCS